MQIIDMEIKTMEIKSLAISWLLVRLWHYLGSSFVHHQSLESDEFLGDLQVLGFGA